VAIEKETGGLFVSGHVPTRFGEWLVDDEKDSSKTPEGLAVFDTVSG
jgi:hypothetical protein